MMKEFVTKLLDDDHGISDEAYCELCRLLHHGNLNLSLDEKSEILHLLTHEVEACENRYYLPRT